MSIKLIILLSVIAIHLIGGIIQLIIWIRDGTMQDAATYGDGIRFADPLDIIFDSLFLWEYFVFDKLIDKINNHLKNKFKNKEENKNGN